MTDTLKTMTYEVTDRVARITFNRPEKGNAIIAAHPAGTGGPASNAPTSTRRARDPGVRPRRRDSAPGFDLSAYADRNRVRPAAIRPRRHGARRQDPGRQPPARPAVGSDGRLPDDEPVRPRLRQPDARRQADRGQDPRLLRGRRHRHRAARRPGDRGRRRQDRLSADAGVGRAGGRAVGAPARRSARQTPSADR